MRFKLLPTLFAATAAAIDISQSSTTVRLSNARLNATWQKNIGAIVDLTLDGRDLLGQTNGSTGIGPYLGLYPVGSE